MSITGIVLTKVTYFGRAKRIDTYHDAMFHGIGTRAGGIRHPLNSVEYPTRFPLELILNNYRLNKIFSYPY